MKQGFLPGFRRPGLRRGAQPALTLGGAVHYFGEGRFVSSCPLVPDPALAGLCDGLPRAPDASRESGDADDYRSADADDGGRHGGIHGAQTNAASSACVAIFALLGWYPEWGVGRTREGPISRQQSRAERGRGRLREVRRRRVSRPGCAQPLRPVSAHRRVGRGVGGRPPEGRRAPARLRAVCESGRERPAQALLPPCGPAQARWTCACPSGGPGRASPASAVSHPISPRTGVPPGTTLARYPPRRTEIRVAWLDEIARLQHPKPRSREARYLEARQPCERVSDSQPPSGLA